MNVTHRQPRGRRLKTYEEGRTCRKQDCITKLSKYNSDEWCYRHAPTEFPRFRGEFTPEFKERHGRND